MDNKILKKTGVTTGIILVVLYVGFLALPLIFNGFIQSSIPQINQAIKDATGLTSEISGLTLVTTPKLTAGFNIKDFKINENETENVLSVENAKFRLSLLPLLIKRIEIDKIQADSISAALRAKKDGTFSLIDNFPEQQASDTEQPAQTELPQGLKLSNKLPDINIKSYNAKFIDIPTKKEYELSGQDFKISDFVFNKKIKLQTAGKFELEGENHFNYDIKIFNKIMPDIDLNEFVFNTAEEDVEKAKTPVQLNIIDIFKTFKKNNFTVDITTNLQTSKNNGDIIINGDTDIENLSIAVDGTQLPEGSILTKFRHNKINIISKLHTSKDDFTEIVGDFKTGSKPSVEMTFRSQAKFNDIISIIDSVANSIGYHNLNTLSAKGGIDADFNLKSDLKKVSSSGYFNVKNSSVTYGLYNMSINKINANIDLSNNEINIKDSGFEILSQPLKVYGQIKQNADADLHLTAEKLPLKGLLLALGQTALLKDNAIPSGTISMNAGLTGKLNKPDTKLTLNAENINIKNIPSNTTITNKNTSIDITPKNSAFSGNITISDFNITNQLASIKLPNGKVNINEKDITLDNSYFLLNNSKINYSGKISNYMTNKLTLDFNLYDNSPMLTINGSISDPAGSMKFNNLAIKTPKNISLEIPNFKSSNLTANANIIINGHLNNPTIKGNAALPLINIPTIKTTVKNVNIDLNSDLISVNAPDISIDNSKMGGSAKISTNFSNGILIKNLIFNAENIDADTLATAMANLPAQPAQTPTTASPSSTADLGITIQDGKGSITKLKSGGIIAENLSSDITLKNNTLFLNNIKGTAFSGNIDGNVSYNIITSAITAKINGENMNAASAIEGASGIKNALSGKLNFGADVSLKGLTEREMMQSLKGKIAFGITDGSLGSIGKLDYILNAQNLNSNSILKAALNSIALLPTVQKTANFKEITGTIELGNSWANLNPIKLSGPAMCYYITGKYNLLTGMTNVTVLGRLAAEVVSALGPLGELSVSKLTGYIPKFGTLTGNILNALTTPPQGENIAAIPALTGGETNYKDFKVIINGNIESASAVKSFKWLSVCDTSAIEKMNLKEQINTTKEAVKETYTNRVEAAKNKLETARQEAQNQAQQMQNLKNNLNNLLKKPAANEPAASPAGE